MKVNFKTGAIGFLLAIGLSAAGSAVAQTEDLPEHVISEFTPGTLISGEAVDLKEMDGKVVVIEWWGTR